MNAHHQLQRRLAPSLCARPRYALLPCAIAVLLGACGGGGGGNNVRPEVSPPPAAPPPTPPVVGTPDPAYSRHLSLTNASAALAAGLSGQGVAVAVVDTGVNRNHPALRGRVTHNLNYVSSPPNNLAVDDVVGHGTAVSLILAGKPFGNWPGGVAPGATIISARIINDARPPDDGSGQGNEVDGALGLAPIHQDLINRGARIMNNSWGGLYWTNPAATAPIAQEYRPFIVGNDGLVVFATGNSSFANPSSMGALPSQPGTGGSRPAADLERGWIVVAALDSNSPSQLAGYSNACGVAMNYCLSAPGSVVTPGTSDSPTAPTYWNWSGTSLSTPLVSGAAALVWQAFPYFNNDLVRQTLLGTANDLGAPGVDPVFGYGALDIGRAVQGPAQFNWGNVPVSFNTVSSTWANVISGNGGLIKRGSGTLRLTAANTFAGDSRVEGGTLAFTSSVPGNAFAEAGGNLVLQAGVAGNLSNSGRVTVQGGAGNRMIGGSYVQSSTATLGYQVGSPLAVAGSASLAGSLQVVGVASGYVRSSQETVLTAGGGLSGSFASLAGGPGVFLEGTLGYDPARAWLDIRRLDVTAAAMAFAMATPVAMASAVRVESAFDRIDSQRADAGASSQPGAISNAFIGLAGSLQAAADERVARASLQSLSGEVHAAADAMTFDAIDAQRRTLSGRFGRLVDVPAMTGEWFQSLAGGGNGMPAAGSFEMSGWLLGSDRRVGNQASAGIAFGETRANAIGSGLGASSRDRQTQAQLYFGSTWGQAYALGQVASGRYERQVQRDLLLGQDAQRVASEYSGAFMSASLEAGYRFGGPRLSLTPYVGADLARVERKGFSEAGAAGFGLRTGDSVGERTQAITGARVERQWTTGQGRDWGLRGFAEWQLPLDARGFDFDASFVGVDSWSPLVGLQPAGSGGMFGVALESRWGENAALSFGLDQRFGARHRERAVSLRMGWGF